MPSMTTVERVGAFVAFLKHIKDPEFFRTRYQEQGDSFQVFGGTAKCLFHADKELMASGLEKLDYFAFPTKDTADYYSKSFMLLLQEGPNHERRREYLGGLVTKAHGRMDLLESHLAANDDVEIALVKFLFEALIDVTVNDDVAEDILAYRKLAAPLSLLPHWLRRSLFRKQHRRLLGIKHAMVARIEAAGHPLADNIFDMLWFNAVSLGFYPQKALEALTDDPQLRAAVVAECLLDPRQRRNTRALVLEMTRLHPRIASINYVNETGVQVAMIPTGNVDPERYENPRAIDLDRDHSDSLTFAMPSNRACLAWDFAPDIMAAVVAHLVRPGARHAP